MKGEFHVRFWTGGGESDLLVDHTQPPISPLNSGHWSEPAQCFTEQWAFYIAYKSVLLMILSLEQHL